MKYGIIGGLVCWAIIIFGISQCNAAEFYFELGIGITDDHAGQPEINLPGPLGKFVFGIEAKNGWAVEYEHISSLQLAEEGDGLNAIWFMKKVYF